MKILKSETEVKCQWNFNGKKLIENDGCSRVQWLRNNYLKKIAQDETGWLILYQDPSDLRYWELFYEFPEMQAGGPVSLRIVAEEDAKIKYKL